MYTIRRTPAARAAAPKLRARDAVLRFEVGRASHRVDEIVGGDNPRECTLQRRRVEAVAAHDAGVRSHPFGQRRGASRQAADPVPARFQQG